MYNTHIRIKNKNHNKLITYQELYTLKYHKHITQADIVNQLISDKIHNIKFSQKQLYNFNNRFNDKYYKRLLLVYLHYTNAINKLNRILANGFNNINQIAKKLNQAKNNKDMSDVMWLTMSQNRNSYNFKDIDLAYKYLRHITKQGDKAWRDIM